MKIIAIALNTFRESIRSKILYSLLLFAFLLVGSSIFFGSVTIGDRLKVIKDFGLFSISVFTVSYSILSGSSLFFKEINRKTLHIILAKPVSRFEFLIGKYLGILSTSTVMLCLMSGGLTLLLYLFKPEISTPLLFSYYHIFLELMIVTAVTIFFSSIVVTPMLIGLFSFSLFLAGRSVSLILYLIDEELVTGFSATILKTVYYLIPNLELLNKSNNAVYNIAIGADEVLWSSCYATGFSLSLVLIGTYFFSKREFH